jgi:hypothetical protein
VIGPYDDITVAFDLVREQLPPNLLLLELVDNLERRLIHAEQAIDMAATALEVLPVAPVGMSPSPADPPSATTAAASGPGATYDNVLPFPGFSVKV